MGEWHAFIGDKGMVLSEYSKHVLLLKISTKISSVRKDGLSHLPDNRQNGSVPVKEKARGSL